MHPKCKQCIVAFGAVILFVSACPFPYDDECPYKTPHEHPHYETHAGPPAENLTMTIASTAAAIDSPNVIYTEPDPYKEGNTIYHVDLTASPTT